MRQLKLAISEPGQWEAFYSVSGESDMLFCPTEETISVGEVIRLRVAFANGPQFLLGGVVMWRRATGAAGGRLRAGVGIRINFSERTKVQYIRGYSRGGLLDKRGEARLPLRLRVTYRASGARRVNFTRDLTRSGMLLATSELFPVGASLELTLMPPADSHPALKVRGEIVRHVEDDRGRAVGISFRFASSGEEMDMRRLVESIERAFHEGRLGEEHFAM
ncbi:MAG: PilZ domain-containing protein [Polyangia bacterium]|jgi:Tfp pilus assembly protein PilZ|nr:PilZ domain-containing protein [Polyangia bacterium]